MITFESVGQLSITLVEDIELAVGIQSDESIKGIQPTYGMLAGDMDVRNIVITFTWSD